MVRIDRLREDSEKRILRCSEGKSIWYQIWMEELEMYYLFFYEVRKGRRILGKGRIKEILDILL